MKTLFFHKFGYARSTSNYICCHNSTRFDLGLILSWDSVNKILSIKPRVTLNINNRFPVSSGIGSAYCNPSAWGDGIRGWLEDGSPPS